MRRFYTGLLIAGFMLSGLRGLAQPGLVISGFLANPAGNDDNKEFVELTATRNIDFTLNPYTVIFNDGGNATAAGGWITGGTGSYAFAVSTGSVAKGGKLYVGGNNIGIYLSGGALCNTATRNTTTGSGAAGIGTGINTGVLGNGGGNGDGIGVFDVAVTSVTVTTVPIDAIFFGTGVGTATGKFPVPTSDKYSNAQGKFGVGTNTFVAPDPGSDLYILATGSYDTVAGTWIGTGRTFSSQSITGTTLTCAAASTITLTAANNLSIAVNTAATTAFLAPPDISGVIGDLTDPAATSGIIFQIRESGVGIPAASYTLTGASNNTTVVPTANILITQSNGSATVKIIPASAGYATITLTLTKNGLTQTYIVNYAASAATSASTFSHTGYSDGSSAYALDQSYMVVVDDEKNILNVYDRTHSGLPVAAYAFGSLLGLTDLSGGIPREVDLEGIAPGSANAGRLYLIGSMSNQSDAPYNDRPNRNRIFAVTATGTGSATSFTLNGYYAGLRGNLLSWGTANGLGLAASAAAGQDPKTTSGFNIEGMAFAPDNTTLYIGFRAPLLPVTNRINALIAPVSNFESWFNNGAPVGSPSIGAPILLDLAGRGIRELYRQSAGITLLLAGDPGTGTLSTQVYRWNGNPVDAPVLLNGFNTAGLNPEGLLNIYAGGVLQLNQLQLISDEGDHVYYGDGTAAKDLSTAAFKKFRSDLVTSPGQPLPVRFLSFDAAWGADHSVQLDWRYEQAKDIVRFVVERSYDGAAFTAAGNVTYVDGTDSRFIDNPDPGVEAVYYRIKAVEASGNAYYTNIRQVRTGAGLDPLRLYPNPVSGNQLHVETGRDGQQYRVMNSTGQVLLQGALKTGTLDVSSLPAGAYQLELTAPGSRQQAMFIKR